MHVLKYLASFGVCVDDPTYIPFDHVKINSKTEVGVISPYFFNIIKILLVEMGTSCSSIFIISNSSSGSPK